MAFKVADRIKEESATTGVGSVSLSGVSVAGFQPFSSGLSDGDYTFYVLEENVAWEVGYGRFTSNTLERTTIFDSTNNGSAISLGGSGTVSVTYPADRSVYLDESLNAVSGSGVTFENSSKILNTDDTYLYWNNDRLADNDDVVYISGIAAYASGEAVASDTSYVSGIATYASGETITNASSISVLNDDTVYLSGLTQNNNVLATYAYERGQLNKTNVEYVSGIAIYASGQSEINQDGLAYISGLAIDASGVRSVSAGSGMDFTDITSVGNVTLGTPSSTTLSSTNSLTATSHTHAFAPGGSTAQYIRGDGSLASFPAITSDVYKFGGTGGIIPASGSNTGGTWSVVSGGCSNTASGDYSTVSGGYQNTASGYYPTVGGGYGNTASGGRSTIGGGASNTASNSYSTVSGGGRNCAPSYSSTVSGGRCNAACATNSSVSGGCKNFVNARHGSINGGHLNVIQSPTNETCSRGATIGGGIGHNTSGGTVNTTNGDITGTVTCCDAGCFSTISGGFRNITTGANSTVGGGGVNCATESSSTVGGGSSNSATGSSSTVAGGQYNHASGTCSTISGGYCNITNASSSTVSGGQFNCATNSSSTVGGGSGNIASGNISTVGGGSTNNATQYASTVSGGAYNTASASYSFIGGGYGHTASSSYSTIGGGLCNVASGSNSTVSGGVSNCASGTSSVVGGGGAFAAGNNAAGDYSTVSGGKTNTASGSYSSIAGGTANNDGGCANAHLIGSNLTATQENTTFVENLHATGVVKASTIIKDGGTSSQFLKADGSVDSTDYAQGSTYVSGIAVYASGSVLKSVASVNSNGNITSDVTLVTTAAATITMTLPAPVTGQVFTVKKVDNGAGSAVVDQNASETIDGATSKTLASQYDSVTVVSDGTNWFII